MNAESPVVLVTGAGGGIGSSVAQLAALHHWKVAVADIDLGAAERATQEISVAVPGCEVMAVAMDVADEGDVDRAFSAVEERWGGVSGLVNNAGFADQTPFLDMQHDQWMREFEVMVSGAIHCIRRALPHMTRTPGSAVVNIASVNGMGFYSHPTYSASKAALLSLTGSLAALFGHTGVRINAIAPGTVITPIWGDAQQVAEKTGPLAPYVPLGKFAQPSDIAEAVLFLLSPGAGQITGATLPVDGGLTTGVLPMAQHISGTR